MPFQQEPIKNFIGRGMTFPLKLNKGRVQVDTGFELLQASITTILTWAFGTRFFLNQFGSQLEELLEEPNDQVFEAVLRHYVVDALAVWERRVDVVGFEILRPRPEAIHLRIKCRVRNSQSEFSFVFPFYDKIIY